MEKQLLIPAPLLDGLVKYLAARPYAEVAPAMQALLALKPYNPDAALNDSNAFIADT